MSRSISAPSSAASAVFFILVDFGTPLNPQFRVTDLLADSDKLAHQLLEPLVFGNLLPGAFHRRTFGNDAGDGLPADRTGEGKLRTVAWGVIVGTVAGWLAAAAIPLDERARPEFADRDELLFDLIELLLE